MLYIPFLRTVHEIADVFNEISLIVDIIKNAGQLQNTLTSLRKEAETLYALITTNLKDKTEIIDKNIKPYYDKLISSIDTVLTSLGTRTMYTLKEAEKKVKSDIVQFANKMIGNIGVLLGTLKDPDFEAKLGAVEPHINAIIEKVDSLQELVFLYPAGTRGTEFLLGRLPILYRIDSKTTADTFATNVATEVDQDPEKISDIYERTLEEVDRTIEEVADQKKSAKGSGLDDLVTELDKSLSKLNERKQRLENEYEKVKEAIGKQEMAEEFEERRQEMEEGIETEKGPKVEVPETEEAKTTDVIESEGSEGSFEGNIKSYIGGFENVELWD
jgi:hypothetical protein